MKRIIRYILIAIFAVLTGCAGLIGLGILFEDEIIAKVTESVNAHLDVPIQVEEIDFSLLSHFPHASVIFKNLSIEDRLDKDLNLLQAEELSLHFDLWDLINGTYVIDQASLNKASLSMRVNEKGEVNYIFWKVPEQNEAEVSLKMESFSLTDIRYSYRDETQDLSLEAFITDALSEVAFKGDMVDILADLNAEQTFLSYEDEVYLEDRTIRFEGPLKVSSDGQDVRFSPSVASVGQMDLDVNGRVHKVESGWMVDLHVDIDEGINGLLPELPPSYRDRFADYGAKGDLMAHLDIKGLSDKTVYPALEAEFTLTDGEIAVKTSKDGISDIQAKGSYHRNEKGQDRLDIRESEGQLSAGEWSFKGQVSDFDSPYVDGTLRLESKLKDLIALQSEPSLTKVSGHLNLNADLKGRIPTEDFNIKDVNALNMRGNLLLEDVNFTLGNDGYVVKDLNGEVLLKEDDLLFDPLTLSCNGSMMSLSGSVSGLLAHLAEEKNVLRIKAKVDSEAVNWDTWAALGKEEDQATEESYSLIPEGLALDLAIELTAFRYGSFMAKDIEGSVELQGKTITLKPLSLNSCKGKLLASASLKQAADHSWTITADGDMRNVDIPELFREFDHFGQDFIQDKHMVGRGNAHISFSGHFSPDMKVDTKSILADADIILDHGELVEHPAMIEIIDALRERNLLKPFVRADELEKEMHHLKFQQLRNHIHVSNGIIEIPEMLIANNAMDIRISGTHTFENAIDYTVSFNMRDILINKTNPEFLIQDDGLGHVLHIKMYGTVDDPQIELDKDKVKANRKEAITQAKEDVKDFFKDPFGKRSDKGDPKHDILMEVERTDTADTKELINKVDTPKKKNWWNSPEPQVGLEEKKPELAEDDDF